MDKTIKKLVVGIAIVVLIGSALGVALLFWLKGKVEKVAGDAADGGLVLVSPPEVVAELAGAKKGYVGSWKSAAGKDSTLDIDAQGNVRFVKDEGGGFKEKTEAPIAAFVGNDMQFRAVITFTIPVTEPPREVGDHWEMTAKGVKLRR